MGFGILLWSGILFVGLDKEVSAVGRKKRKEKKKCKNEDCGVVLDPLGLGNARAGSDYCFSCEGAGDPSDDEIMERIYRLQGH